MVKQTIFDTIVSHMMAQAEPAVEDGCPKYLCSDGKRCAIGCLMPDGHPALKANVNVKTVLERNPDLANLWGVSLQIVEKDGNIWAIFDNPNEVRILQEAQHIHDNTPPRLWKQLLIDLGNRHSLSISSLQNT